MTDTLELVLVSPWSAAPGPQTTVEQLFRACIAFDLDVRRLYGKIRLVPNRESAEVPAIPTLLDVLFGSDHAVDVVVRDVYYPGTVDADLFDV